MADADLIAHVFPYGPFTEVISDAMKTSSHHVFPQVETLKPRPAYRPGERESTEPPDNPSIQEQSGLALKFSSPPRSRHGYVFGTDPARFDFSMPNS